jgi:SulP family sulfate permease
MASVPCLKSFSFRDILAGISVALVVIPQSLAYAELAGMPAYTGLIAAALPSVTAACFVSSPYLQTGPVVLTSFWKRTGVPTISPCISKVWAALI